MVSTSTSNDPRRVIAGTCAPRTKLYVSARWTVAARAGVGPDRQCINSDTHTTDSLPSPLWLTTAFRPQHLHLGCFGRLQYILAPITLTLSLQLPDAVCTLFSFCLSTIPNVCHNGFFLSVVHHYRCSAEGAISTHQWNKVYHSWLALQLWSLTRGRRSDHCSELLMQVQSMTEYNPVTRIFVSCSFIF